MCLSFYYKYGLVVGSFTSQFLMFVFSAAISFFFVRISLRKDSRWLVVARSEVVFGRDPDAAEERGGFRPTHVTSASSGLSRQSPLLLRSFNIASSSSSSWASLERSVRDGSAVSADGESRTCACWSSNLASFESAISVS